MALNIFSIPQTKETGMQQYNQRASAFNLITLLSMKLELNELIILSWLMKKYEIELKKNANLFGFEIQINKNTFSLNPRFQLKTFFRCVSFSN